MQYSTKQLNHDIRLLNNRVQATDNNMYRLRKPDIQIETMDRSHQLGKAIVITVNDSPIIVPPELPFPETALRQALPKPNNQLIHDLQVIFEKYQNWYFQH